MKKRLLVLFLCLTLVASMIPAVAVDFADTEGHWAESSIDRWSDYGVIQGDGTGAFNPNSDITRAEAAQIFANLLKLKKTADVSVYSDVDPDAWYADAIAETVAGGIMKGVGGDRMDPNGTVTREQFFVMFARALGIPEADEADRTFADSAQVDSWAAGAVNALVNKGYIKGAVDAAGNVTVSPDLDIDRASAMTLLDQTITAYANEDGATVEGAGAGVVLVVADDVTVTGEVKDLVVAADEVNITLEDATVTGEVIVNADSAALSIEGESTVASVVVTETAGNTAIAVGEAAKVEEIKTEAAGTEITGEGEVAKVEATGDAAGDVKVETAGTEVTRTDAEGNTATETTPEAEVEATPSPSPSANTGSTYTGGSDNSGSAEPKPEPSQDPDPEPVAVTGVTLDKNSLDLTLVVGETVTGSLTAAVSPADADNKAVTWSSSDETVAAVEGGTVTALKAGTATITVTTADGGFTATCEVTVVDDNDVVKVSNYQEFVVAVNEAREKYQSDPTVENTKIQVTASFEISPAAAAQTVGRAQAPANSRLLLKRFVPGSVILKDGEDGEDENNNEENNNGGEVICNAEHVDLYIPEGVTLTVDHAQINVHNDTNLYVYGTLKLADSNDGRGQGASANIYSFAGTAVIGKNGQLIIGKNATANAGVGANGQGGWTVEGKVIGAQPSSDEAEDWGDFVCGGNLTITETGSVDVYQLRVANGYYSHWDGTGEHKGDNEAVRTNADLKIYGTVTVDRYLSVMERFPHPYGDTWTRGSGESLIARGVSDGVAKAIATIYGGGSLTIRSGGSLIMDIHLDEEIKNDTDKFLSENNAIIVKSGGTLTVSEGVSVRMSDETGKITVEEGGTLHGDTTPEDTGNKDGTTVETFDALKAAANDKATKIAITGDINISEALPLEEGTELVVAGEKTLTISATLTNCNAINIAQSGKLIVAEGGSVTLSGVDNHGTISIAGTLTIAEGDFGNNGDGTVEVTGTLAVGAGAHIGNDGNLTISGTGKVVSNTNEDDGDSSVFENSGGTLTIATGGSLKVARLKNDGDITAQGELTITGVMAGPEGEKFRLAYNGKCLTVDGGTATMTGDFFNGEQVTVKGGGSLTVIGTIDNGGATLTVTGENSKVTANKLQNAGGSDEYTDEDGSTQTISWDAGTINGTVKIGDTEYTATDGTNSYNATDGITATEENKIIVTKATANDPAPDTGSGD